MDFDLTSDQRVLLSAIDSLVAPYGALQQPAGPDYLVYGDALDRELETAGFYGDASGSGLELADAALVLEQIARTPFAVPAMASLIVGPAVRQGSLPRPIALLSSFEAPARFLGQAKTALIAAGDAVLLLDLAGVETVPLGSIFAYPYARLGDIDRSRAVTLEGVGEAFRNAWRLGLTYEMLGAMRSAHALTVDYVKQREQFKRPIGSFQAVQHRLGEDATRIEAIHYLAARAAWSNEPADIALAASYAQAAAANIVYDCHQFHGAMGLTLEYVLHHWTYRLKVLSGELGGSAAQARAAARALWGQAA